jgi:signal transduction histidine kinase/ligand-binding sensor domain-containing protein/DNA-binding response OmpR family regulator
LVERLPEEDPAAALLRRTHIVSLCPDPSGDVYIGTHYNGMYVFDSHTRTLTNIDQSSGLSSNTVRDIVHDGEGRLMIGTEFGINILNRADGTVHILQHTLQDRSNLNDNAIYSIYRDREDNIWVGTYFGGVNICLREFSNFTYYPSGSSDSHLSGQAVREITRNDARSMWVATEDGGLNLFDHTARRFRHYTALTGNVRVSYHNVHSVAKDHNGNLWIGLFTGGINRLDIARNTMRYYNRANTGAPINNTFTVIEDGDRSAMWFGGTGGLSRYDFATDRITTIRHPLINARFVYYMIQDAEGILWLAMRNYGVATYDPVTGNAYKIETGGKFGGAVSTLFEDSHKNIWMGSSDRGLLHYDRQNDTMAAYCVEDGLPSNAVMSINEDRQGRIWIGTEKGLSCFDPLSSVFQNYTTENGLPSDQFNYSSSYRADGREFYFGLNGGIVAFHPDSLRVYPRLRNIIVTALYINGEPVHSGEEAGGRVPLQKSIIEQQSITLNHKQAKLFGLGFTSFNFSRSSVMYQMSIDGSAWQDVGPHRQVTFSNLKAGEHTVGFRISPSSPAGNVDAAAGDRSGTEATFIGIEVLPSFWMSWVGFLMYAVILAGLAFAAFSMARIKLRYNARLERERIEKESVREMNSRKISFFTNISHELKTPLTLILSPLDKLGKDRSLPEKVRRQLDIVSRNARRMLFMTDELMTFSKIEMGHAGITVQRGAVLPFIDEMCQIFRIVATERNLNLVVEVDGDNSTQVWFSPGDVEKIINNLMSNAFKWGEETIVISAVLENHDNGEVFLRLQVRDSGIGIPVQSIRKIFDNYYQVNPADSNSGSGIGLAYTKALVNLHHGTISVESEQGRGTEFTVMLNVSEGAFTAGERSALPLDADMLSTYKYNITADKNFDGGIFRNVVVEGESRQKLLVVEDNRELNEFICDIFRDKFTVIPAFDGKQGLEMALKIDPDVIITDIMMPVMDGCQLTRTIKDDLATSHIVVVMLTAKTALEDSIAGLEHGADAYIKKPFNARSLELQVLNIMATRASNIHKFKNTPNIDVSQIIYNPRDERFMNEVVKVIRDNMDNEALSVDFITEKMGTSRSLLYLKLKKLAGISATELIRNIRLGEAQTLLREGYNVSEVSYAIGISDPNYFTKYFKKQFGITPTEYVKVYSKIS